MTTRLIELSTPIGVAIVSYNTCTLLRACLASLQRCALPLAIAVVDNGSRDQSTTMVRDEFPGVLLIEPGENLGFARGTNLGMQRLIEAYPTMRYMLMLNPDTVVHDGAIETLVGFLEAHPRVAVVSPQLRNPDETLQRAAFRFPTPMMTFFDLFPPGVVTPGRFYDSWWHGRYPQEVIGDVPFAIDHPLGACMLTRVDVLNSIGMLDESYFMYVEEVDWSRRVRAAGWAIWQEPAAVVMHVGGASSQQFKAAMLTALWQSRRLYWQRWATPAELRWHRRWLRLGMMRLHMRAWWQRVRGQLSPEAYAEQAQIYRSLAQL
jgi:N-acetylglucosaminyl-diphospho-decaprenol L-rhamnosyltransferase